MLPTSAGLHRSTPRDPRSVDRTPRAMSPPRLRASLSPPLLPLLLLVLLEVWLPPAAGWDPGAAGPRAPPASGSAGGSSGRFVSREQHVCSWQLPPASPGAAAASELTLRCQGPGGARHQCAYRGEPGRCAAYGARRSHYWKQVLGALRRKRRPCHDPAPVHIRLCAGRGAELRLVARATPPAHPTAAGFPEKPTLRARSRGRPRQLAPASRAPPKKKPSLARTKGGRRKAGADPVQERPMATGPHADGWDRNAELTETYCAEKWHSLCNFFVNFWNG